jgi:hypothetical protein
MACIMSKPGPGDETNEAPASSGRIDTVALANVMAGRAELKLNMHGEAKAGTLRALHLKARSEAAIPRAKTLEPPTPHHGWLRVYCDALTLRFHRACSVILAPPCFIFIFSCSIWTRCF